MKNLRVTFIFILLLIVTSSYGIEYQDVQKMGDIWVVTIDKSGSMRFGGSPSAIAENVYNRLLKGECFSSADFSKDRFLFLTSGYSYSKDVGLGNELTRAPSLGGAFIHATDNKIYSFGGKEECASHIRKILAENDYNHQLSFVSQIRLFSIVHAVNKLKKDNETQSFHSFKILTITDDADQNDQWMNDYRTLKSCAPNKVKEVNDSTAKYIYNSINGKGNGNLNELFSDEKNIPHIWVYQYQSKEQNVPEMQLDLLSVKAGDGENFAAKIKTHNLLGDKICFYHIDSIRINKKIFKIDRSYTDEYISQCSFDNGLKRNRTTIWGYIQVEYQDGVFGPHYKTIPFVQESVVASQNLELAKNVALALMALCIFSILLFFFVISPNRTVFTVFSSIGKKTVLKRGYSRNWKGEHIPFQCYQDDGKGVFGVIVKKHHNIRNYEYPVSTPDTSEVLICSRYLLGISAETVFHSTEDDLDRIYFSRTADYSELLRNEYEKTVFYRLRKKYYATSWKWMQRLIRRTIDFLNFFNRKYYYVIRDIKRNERIYISADTILIGKRFVIEYHNAGHGQNSLFDYIVQKALTYYYNTEEIKYDVILCSLCAESSIFWVVIRLDDNLVARNSLRSVNSLIRYEQSALSGDRAQMASFIIHSLAKEFPHKKSIGYIDVTGLSADMKPLSFSIKESTAPGFVTFIETAERPRVQTMYSPVKEADTKEKFITPNHKFMSGYLYLSAIPIRKLPVNDVLVRQLSKTVIKSEEKQPSLLKLMNDHFEFRNIKEKF